MCLQFNGSSWNLWIVCLFITILNNSLYANTFFPDNPFKQASVPHNHLHHAIHIAQVNKRNTAMITDIFYPACNPDLLVYITLTNLV